MYYRYIESDREAKQRHDDANKAAAAKRYSDNREGRSKMKKARQKK